FNNDGVFEIVDSNSSSATVPSTYLADGPSTRTVHARIKDKDGGSADYTFDITVDNVTPIVNAGPDGSVGATQTFSQNGSFTDPGTDTWIAKVDYDFTGPGTHDFNNGTVSLPLSGKNFTLSHVYNTPGSYTIRVYVQDDDGAIGFDDVVVTVGN